MQHVFACVCRFCARNCTRIESVHRIATYNKLKSGCWREQVRRKARHASKTFRLKSDGEAWAFESERVLAIARRLHAPRIDRRGTFGQLIQLDIADMSELGKAHRRSKAKCLAKLEATSGRVALHNLTRERLIEFAQTRAKEGIGPMTLGMDIGDIRTVLVHAAARSGLRGASQQVTLARVALRRLRLVGQGNERDRRPALDEFDPIMTFNDNNPRQTIRVGRLVKFAVATAMRREAICRLLGTDVDFAAQLATGKTRAASMATTSVLTLSLGSRLRQPGTKRERRNTRH